MEKRRELKAEGNDEIVLLSDLWRSAAIHVIDNREDTANMDKSPVNTIDS